MCFLVPATTRQRWPKEGMLPDPTAGIMLLIGQTPPAVREYKGCCSEGMNLLIGQLSFPQALGRNGPWPPVGSQDASVSCSDINHAQ